MYSNTHLFDCLEGLIRRKIDVAAQDVMFQDFVHLLGVVQLSGTVYRNIFPMGFTFCGTKMPKESFA